jgi:tRNA (guanine-N7-)-methyltransferase
MQPPSPTPSAIPTLIHRPATIVNRLDLAALYPKPQPLEVELGSGDGSFLAQWAQRHPERNYFGVERLLGRLRKLDRKGRRAGLLNLRLIRMEASYVLEFLLPPSSVEALHVYFPDPWPKRRHRQNRLVNERFTELTAQVLRPGGVIYLRTDDADYFSQMTAVFAANERFQAVETPAELQAVVTDFERGFQSRGVATLGAAFQQRRVT